MVTTPRKAHKFSAYDIGNMEVMSIVDHERAQQQHLDRTMDSAVDQLEALTDPTMPRPEMVQAMVRFGAMKLDDIPLQFDFEPPTTSRIWPGPKYGPHSLHKRLHRPTKPRPSSVRKHSRNDDQRHAVRARQPPSMKQEAKSAEDSPSDLRSVAARDPPLYLLGLPPEVRNHIWSLLAVREGPIEAQLRQIQPCRRLSKHRCRTIRKFPWEPVVAGVNHQVRREVLSIFYGTNRFVFEKNACKMFEGYSMTNPTTMQKWSPSTEIANFLSHVDIKFNAWPKGSLDPVSIVFGLRKARDKKVTIDIAVEKTKKKKAAQVDRVCLCEELDAVEMVQSEVDKDLMHVATILVKKRNEISFSSPTLTMLSKNDKRYPQGETCTRCEKPTLEIVYSGM